jgi:hypothetical protein
MNTLQNHSSIHWLSLAKGRVLSNVQALVFIDAESSSINIQELSLHFEQLRPIRIFCGCDGSSICSDDRVLEAQQIGEYGEVLVRDISTSDEIWKNLTHKTLDCAYLVESTRENRIFAIQLIFSDSSSVSIANLGDELVVQERLSQEVTEEENAKFWVVNNGTASPTKL